MQNHARLAHHAVAVAVADPRAARRRLNLGMAPALCCHIGRSASDQGVQRRQRQLMLQQASLPTPKANANAGGGGGNEEFDDDDELPQPVFDRIIRRIVVAVGLPMASGVALLNVYDAIKRGQGMEVPTWLPLLTILLSFGTSALGIAYGTLSASWDPEKEGSLLGIDEVRANWPVLWAEEIEKEKAKARKKK